jgi:DNA repair exonuclease SbcCD nuclease subunit
MMRFGLSADWHFAGYTQDKLIGNLPERLRALKSCIESILIHCREHGIDRFVIAGDILHGKSIIYALAQSVLIDLFNAHSDIEFIIIDGNHDLSGKGNDAVSALRGLVACENVVLISRSMRDYFEYYDIAFVPYAYDMAETIKKNSCKYLVSHFGLNEAILNSGVSIVSKMGLKDLIGKYECVFLGHYHTPQEIISDEIKVYYAGSPIQLDWGEKHEEKRFLIVDTDAGTIESVPTIGYKQHHEFKITNENKDEIIEKAKKFQAIGHEVRIFRDDLDVDVEHLAEEFLIIDKAERDITDRGIESSMSLDEKFLKYMDIKGIKPEDQPKYLEVGLRIVEKAAKEL